MTDVDILKLIWDGKIPICFILSEKDLFPGEKICPLYMLIPRMSYFHLLLDKLNEYFKKYTHINENSQMWFSFNNKPLKSHYPVGLLYDLCCHENQKLPWQITVNLNNFPADKLIDTSKLHNLESHFIYTIKEADYLKSRGLIIQSFQKQEMETLWSGLKNDNQEQFWSVNRKLVDPEKINSEASKALGDGQSGGQSSNLSNHYKLIPMRIYQINRVGFLQKPIKPINEKGEQYLVSDIPRLFDLKVDNDFWEITTHGIKLPNQTALQWLSEHMTYPDNFLHLVFSNCCGRNDDLHFNININDNVDNPPYCTNEL